MSEHECKECKQHFTVPFDMEPTDYCNSCAQELLPTALARAESAERRAITWELEHNAEKRKVSALETELKDTKSLLAIKNDTANTFLGQINKLHTQIETLETRNRQLVQAMGQAVLRVQMVIAKDEHALKQLGEVGELVDKSSTNMLEEALALLKEMGKEG